MCLDRIDETIEKPTKKVVTAWGAFILSSAPGHVELLCIPLGEAYTVPCGVWLRAKNVLVRTNRFPGIEYMTGFHKSFTRREARQFVLWLNYTTSHILILKVKLRQVRLKGLQLGGRVYVADEMLIPRVSRAVRKPRVPGPSGASGPSGP